MTTKSSIGSRGKAAEKTVDTLLKKWNNRADFAYFRLPDARAARGFLTAQPGDFAYYKLPNAGIIEVKETEHEYRIAKDKISQLAVLQKLDLAGARSVILIHHSTLKQWRCMLPSQLEVGVPSWDLRAFPLFHNAEQALLSTGYFQ